MLSKNAKEALVELYIKNTLADGYKVVNKRLSEIQARLLDLDAAILEADELIPDRRVFELTATARQYLHSQECERRAIAARRQWYAEKTRKQT